MTGCSVTFLDGTVPFDETDEAHVCFDSDGHPQRMVLIMERIKQLIKGVDPCWLRQLEHPYKFAALFVHAAYLVAGEDLYPHPMICDPLYNWGGNDYEYLCEWGGSGWVLKMKRSEKVLATVTFYGD